jgi:hypothetical protein
MTLQFRSKAKIASGACFKIVAFRKARADYQYIDGASSPKLSEGIATASGSIISTSRSARSEMSARQRWCATSNAGNQHSI